MKIADASPNLFERLAYQKAGHIVISFLIRKGYTDKYIPFGGRSLTELKQVTLEEQGLDWANIEQMYSLADLILVPQILLAGYITERIKYNGQDDDFPSDSPLVKQALHLIACHVSEYASNKMTALEREQEELSLFQGMFDYVNDQLHLHWKSVEALVFILLEQKMLSENQAFELIEKDIPTNERANAERRLKGDHLDAETRKWIEELRVKHLSKAKSKASNQPSKKEKTKMKRYGQVLGIKPEHIEEYTRLHAAVWPEVLKMIHECNIRNYSIYLHDKTLFAYFEYHGDNFEADMAKMAADPNTQRWWDVCKPLQDPLSTRAEGEWWANMKEVFHTD